MKRIISYIFLFGFNITAIHFKEHLKNNHFQLIEINIVIAPNNINMTKSKFLNPSIEWLWKYGIQSNIINVPYNIDKMQCQLIHDDLNIIIYIKRKSKYKHTHTHTCTIEYYYEIKFKTSIY